MSNTDQSINHEVVVDDDGNGYVATVSAKGETVYNSQDKYGKKDGTFELEHDAMTHARAWAQAERDHAPEVARIKRQRQELLGGEVLVLKEGARGDLDQAETLKKGAKTCKENADGQEARIETLARQTKNPRIKIEWADRKDPASVRLMPEASAWDEEFSPQKGDPNQLSLARVTWSVVRDGDGQLERLVGYGQSKLTIEDGKLVVIFGASEHRIEAAVTDLRYTATDTGSQKAPNKKKSTGKKGAGAADKPVEVKRGKLGQKALLDRITHIEDAETLMGIYQLEKEHAKPRQPVLDAVNERAVELDIPALITDLASVDAGQGAEHPADRAAAALVTSSKKASVKLLEQLVPDCTDRLVLGWVLDDETDRGEEARDEVCSVVRARLALLVPKANA